MGRTVLLFALVAKADDRSFWFLGNATYVRHEGERPDGNHLETPPPAPRSNLYQEFAAAVV